MSRRNSIYSFIEPTFLSYYISELVITQVSILGKEVISTAKKPPQKKKSGKTIKQA